MKLEVGMYVRTDKGLLGKLLSKEKDGCGFILKYEGQYNKKVWSSLGTDSEIIKASFNLIDLIEVGDYVNGMRVKNIMSVGTSQYVIKKGDDKYVCCGDYGLMDDGSGRSCYALQWNNNQIKEVLTHEQYEANCYKVGE